MSSAEPVRKKCDGCKQKQGQFLRQVVHFCAEGLQKVRELNQICIRKKYESGRSCGFTCGNDFFVPHGNLDGTFEKYNIIKIYDAVIDLKMYGRS